MKPQIMCLLLINYQLDDNDKFMAEVVSGEWRERLVEKITFVNVSSNK